MSIPRLDLIGGVISRVRLCDDRVSLRVAGCFVGDGEAWRFFAFVLRLDPPFCGDLPVRVAFGSGSASESEVDAPGSINEPIVETIFEPRSLPNPPCHLRYRGP